MNKPWRLTNLVVLIVLLISAAGTPNLANAASAPVPAPAPAARLSSTPPPPSQAHSTTGPRRPVNVTINSAIVPSLAAHIIDVPTYLWRHGCGPTAAGMVMGYWDLHGFDNLYTTADASTQDTSVDEGIASSLGDQNHVNDYALPDDSYTPSIEPDCSNKPGCVPHPSNSIADFMFTSFASHGMRYGWSSYGDMGHSMEDYVRYVNQTRDSDYFTTTSDYAIWNNSMTTLWNVYTQEIDAGRPVVFLVDSDGDGSTDHFVTGTGYDINESGQKLYRANDTWDHDQEHWFSFRAMTAQAPWGIYGLTTFKIGSLSAYSNHAYMPSVIAPQPKLSVSEVKLYDTPQGAISGWSNGNNDGKANPGEFIVMGFRFENPNITDLYDLTLKLEINDPYVNNKSVYNPYYQMENYINWQPGNSYKPLFYAFHLMIARSVPSGHIVKYNIHVTNPDGGDWSFPGSFSISGADTTPPLFYFTSPHGGYYPVGSALNINGLVLEAGSLPEVTAKAHSVTGTNAATITLYDNGTNGDNAAWDRLYRRNWAPTAAIDYLIDYTAKDDLGNAATYPNLGAFSAKPFKASKSILLVMDLPSTQYESFYTKALAANGYTYDLWSTYYRGVFDPTVLTSYLSGVVIYAVPFSGEIAFSNGIQIRAGLASYLDKGGQLFITGQDVGYFLAPVDNFYSKYLHAQYVQDNPYIYTLKGVPGDTIGSGLAINLQGGTGANNQYYPDEINPIAPAVPIFLYDASGSIAEAPQFDPQLLPAVDQPKALEQAGRTAQPAGVSGSGTAGLRVQSGSYKVVYLSFGFEGINSDAMRNTVMKRIITWLRQP